MWKCTTHILWYITVLSMGPLSVKKYVPLIVAVIYVMTGDYLSLMRHIQYVL